jgi:Copper transport outer membrane protein, MctB
VISFRYHLVSLVAVLLALALGLALGATGLSGAVLDDLRGQLKRVSDERRALQADVRTLRGQVRTGDGVTAALAPRIVAGTLRGARVVLVAAPQADAGLTDGLQQILEQAGARITGRLRLTADFADPRRSADLKSFVTSGGQPAGFQLPESDDAGVLGAALLSYVLVRGTARGADPAAVSQVLSGFSTLQMLRPESGQVTPADLAVVVAGRPGGADADRALGQLVAALDRAGKGAVVAGTAAAAGPDGLIGLVRADAALATAVSTVDDVQVAAGRLATVFALSQQASGAAGQYGAAGNADAPFPPT